MQLPFKKSLVFQIPSASVLLSISTWAEGTYFSQAEEYKQDPYNLEHIQNKAVKFIDQTLKEQGLELDNYVKNWLRETVSNAYDAHLNQAKLGHPLTLKLVVKTDLLQLSVNIMDNGAGFLNQPKRVLFKYKDIHEAKKERTSYIGGMGIGLRRLDNKVQQANGRLFFKNRKEQGATVSLKFPLEAMTTIQTKPEPPKMQESPDTDAKRHCTII